MRFHRNASDGGDDGGSGACVTSVGCQFTSIDLGDAMEMRRPMSNWTKNCRALAAVIALVPLLLAVPAAAEKRIALVVGDSAYQNITRLDKLNAGTAG